MLNRKIRSFLVNRVNSLVTKLCDFFGFTTPATKNFAILVVIGWSLSGLLFKLDIIGAVAYAGFYFASATALHMLGAVVKIRKYGLSNSLIRALVILFRPIIKIYFFSFELFYFHTPFYSLLACLFSCILGISFVSLLVLSCSFIFFIFFYQRLAFFRSLCFLFIGEDRCRALLGNPGSKVKVGVATAKLVLSSGVLLGADHILVNTGGYDLLRGYSALHLKQMGLLPPDYTLPALKGDSLLDSGLKRVDKVLSLTDLLKKK